MPELRNLRAFVEVAEQLSFTHAAESLHLRQQTVSRMVRDLERELGVELLERTTRHVRVTRAGLGLLEEGRAILRSADAAFDAARSVGSGHGGTVRIGTTPPIGLTDRAEVARALRKDRRGLSVAFMDLRPGELRESLGSRRVDFALTRVSGTTDDALDCAQLRRTPIIVCLPAGHPLANRVTLRPAELDGQALLVPSPVGTPYTDMLIAAFDAAGAVVSPVESRVTGGTALLAEVDQEQAMAVMPAGTTYPGGAVSVPIEDLTLPLFALWPAGRPPESIERLRRSMGHSEPLGRPLTETVDQDV